jgi:hypothetical protein
MGGFASRRLKAVLALMWGLMLLSSPDATTAAFQPTILFQQSAPSGYTGVGYSQARNYGGGQLGGMASTNTGVTHAMIWSAATGPVDLTPPGFNTFAVVNSTNGVQQVGEGAGSGTGRALLWNGSAASYVDLTPTQGGYTGSAAYFTNGTYQVGRASIPGHAHAMVWAGSSSSALDLHPTNLTFEDSLIFGISNDGTRQVGEGLNASSAHALLWHSTAYSVIDLNPISLGYSTSVAYDVEADQIVGGTGSTSSGSSRALLWQGSSHIPVDLSTNLVGYSYSIAVDTNGFQEVGWGYGTSTGGLGNKHALLWSGTAASVVDLHAFLPAGHNWYDSRAIVIDSAGNVFGTAAYFDPNGASGIFAVKWSFVPEPGLGLIAPLVNCVLLRRRRH